MPFDPGKFHQEVLLANGIDTAFGVPDSSLSGLLAYVSATQPVSKHIVTANEGAAIALAAGYYMCTGRVALAYMQNSGLANALNPLQSMAAKEVFGIPMLLMIGWRGKPGEKDEPQHALIGPHLLDNLHANDIPYEEVPDTLADCREAIARLTAKSLEDKTPVAFVLPRKTFAEYKSDAPVKFPPPIFTGHSPMKQWTSWAPTDLPLSRERAISCVLGQITNEDVSISSLGGNSRELYMLRKENKEPIGRNFFLIGAMGHAYALSYGVSMAFQTGRVFCIDGDGSFIMHVGNNALLAGVSPPNLIHIVIYNGVYSSTGSQPLTIRRENLVSLAQGLPYKQKFFVDSSEGLKKACKAAHSSTLIIVAVNDSCRDDLPRPTETTQQMKEMFMESFRV